MFEAIGLLDNGDHAWGKACKRRIQVARRFCNLGQAKRNRDVDALAAVTVLGMFVLMFGKMVAMIRRLRMNVILALFVEGRLELDMPVRAEAQNRALH